MNMYIYILICLIVMIISQCMYKIWLWERFQGPFCKAMKKVAAHKCLIVSSLCWVSMKSKCCCKSYCKQPTLPPSCFWIPSTNLMLPKLHRNCVWRRAKDALPQLEHAESYTSTCFPDLRVTAQTQ